MKTLAINTIQGYLDDEFKDPSQSKRAKKKSGANVSAEDKSVAEQGEPDFEAQKAVEEEVHLQELRKMGTEIGESMIEAYKQLAKDVKAAKPNYELISCVAGLDLILKRIKQIPYPYHLDQTANHLQYECGHTLKEVKEKYKAMLGG